MLAARNVENLRGDFSSDQSFNIFGSSEWMQNFESKESGQNAF